jgi:tetratricopeptide (TPR) repeat protein
VRRCGWPLVILLSCAFLSSAQAILEPLQPETETVRVAFSTPSGNVDSPTAPASFDSSVTIILDPSALQMGATSPLLAALQKLFSRRTAAPIEIVLLRANEPPLSVTAQTRAQLQTGIKTLVASAPPDAGPISFDLLSGYLQTPPRPENTWKQIVFAGPEPDVPEPLKEYCSALLARELAAARIRLMHYRDGASPAWWDAALAATGGGPAADLASAMDSTALTWSEAKVPEGGPPAGFRLAPLQAGNRSFPWIWTRETKPLPSPAEFADFLNRRAALVRALAATGAPAAPALSEWNANLARVLALNPYDRESLGLAVDFADRTHDYPSAVRYASRISEIEPENGANFARLGVFRWNAGDSQGAQQGLLRARELHADHPQSAAILGDIHAAAKDYKAAVTEYSEAVKREPERVELWLKLADNQEAAGSRSGSALALEEALKRRPEMWDRRTQIIDYYLSAGDGVQALRQVQTAIPLLPADARLDSRFAEYAERLERADDAAKLWARVIELDRVNEAAYYSLARLQSQAKKWDQVLATTEAGVTAVPSSGRIEILRVDALTALGRIDDARRDARRAADRFSDPQLNIRAAVFEDRYGTDAPQYYKAAIETSVDRAAKPDKSRGAELDEDGLRAAAEHGLISSIRERQPAACAWFAARLESKVCGGGAEAAARGRIAIPGGVKALLFVTHGPPQSSAADFLADYTQTLNATRDELGVKELENYTAQVLDYFHMLTDLKSMGVPGRGETVVRLSFENAKSRQITERVLEMLGWRSHRSNGKVVVEQATGAGSAKYQRLAAALNVDLLTMQENLQAGKEFTLRIPEDPVEIYPDESQWRQEFYPREQFAGGFAEALVRKPEMASLYAALAEMEPEAARLVAESGLRYMAERYGRLLSQYSSCLEVSAGRIRAPGGDEAIPVWTDLAGISPDSAGRFIRALLDKDDGRLIHFYFLLSQLDFSRQRFFTASRARARSIYGVFRQSNQVIGKTAVDINASRIEDLFREIPLDETGRILFPGGPAVWMVAKNQSSSVQATDKRLSKVARQATPDVEDQILVRLMGQQFSQNGYQRAAWQNFLAVVRVEAARREPLDEASALLLAEKYGGNRGLYTYFAGLTALGAAEYREVFQFTEKFSSLDRKKANIALGLFQSALYLLTDAERSGKIAPERTAALLLDFARAMNQGQSPSEWCHAALDFLGAYIQSAGGDRNSRSLRDILVPAAADRPVELGNGHSVNPLESIRRNFDAILDLQKVPSTGDLLKIHAALLTLSSGKGDRGAAVAVIANLSGKLEDVPLPKKQTLDASDLELLKSSETSRYAELSAAFRKEIAKKKPDAGHFQSLAEDYWEALAFRTVNSLAGQIYALNFRSDDLVIAEDPFFLRKHQFVPWRDGPRDYLQPADLQLSGTGAGSRITGGFEGISTVSGRAAVRGLRGVNPAAEFVSWALLGTVRATDWSSVNQATLRNVEIRIHAAEDWLVLAAAHPAVMDEISRAAYGLLSLNRRARLLLGLRNSNWDEVWSSVTLSDLYFLAGRLKAREEAGGSGLASTKSPSIDGYLALKDSTPAEDSLGPMLERLRRRFGPGMIELPPYEEIAAESHPIHLAERVAEFKLYLVRLFAQNALPAEVLPTVAEAAARSIAADIQMTGLRDWQAVLHAYDGFTNARLREVMGK